MFIEQMEINTFARCHVSVCVLSRHPRDNPPRPECAPRWHEGLLKHLPDLKLTLLIGRYAHRYYLGARQKTSMTETVKAFSQYGPQFFPLPHPSWRSTIWIQKNPWSERDAGSFSGTERRGVARCRTISRSGIRRMRRQRGRRRGDRSLRPIPVPWWSSAPAATWPSAC